MDNKKFESIAQFYINVIKNSPEFKNNKPVKCKKPELLEPDFSAKITELKKICEEEKGLKLQINETFRTNALQLHYYNIGSSKIKLNGMHHYGIAQDILCLDSEGEIIESGEAEEYTVLRETALSLGLFILPRWDAGHMQFVSVADQNSLRNYIANYRAKKYVILLYGCETHNVINLKIALKELGFYNETLAVADNPLMNDPAGEEAKPATGILSNFFGEDTHNALELFQEHYNLKKDGIAGEEVYTKLSELGYDITK